MIMSNDSFRPHEIRPELERALADGCTHLIRAMDPLENEIEFHGIKPGEDPREAVQELEGAHYLVMEVYDLRLPLQAQFAKGPGARHF